MDLEAIERALREQFQFPEFRPGQRELIEASLSGRDALGVLPTGGGKSLTYQLPATVLRGLTLVVSPLIALMKDQVDSFNSRGLGQAVALHSNLATGEGRVALARAAKGEVSLLYVAPERLEFESTRERILSLKPRLLVIDEAHCVNQWGHDFRPSYMSLAGIVKMMRPAPVLALTATATPATRREIIGRLELSRPLTYVAPFDRPNLSFEVVPCTPSDKVRQLISILRSRAKTGSHIVYVGRRADADEVGVLLSAAGIPSVSYHAGMNPGERRDAQDAWLSGSRPVVVATVAFGMGIDKPDVRTVVHYQHPASLEGYYQEAGRAGRDGIPARCILLFSSKDVALAQFFIRNRYPSADQVKALFETISPGGTDPAALRGNFSEMSAEQLNVALLALEEQHRVWRNEEGQLCREEVPPEGVHLYLGGMFGRKKADYTRLNAVLDYSRETGCNRATLLRYFGEQLPESFRCGNCSACRGRAVVAGDVIPGLRIGKAPERVARAPRRPPVPVQIAPRGDEQVLWESPHRRYRQDELKVRQVPRRTGLAILTLVAGAGLALAPSTIVGLLRGKKGSTLRLRRPTPEALERCGSEKERRYGDVLEDVLAMWAKGYLERSDGRKRTLELSASGRSILE
jgi:ATP-dependent DNA helicase RecQ